MVTQNQNSHLHVSISPQVKKPSSKISSLQLHLAGLSVAAASSYPTVGHISHVVGRESSVATYADATTHG